MMSLLTRNTQHVTHNTQHATRNTQHASQAVCSRLAETLRLYPKPCRVLGLDVNRAFMAALAGVVLSFIGTLIRIGSTSGGVDK